MPVETPESPPVKSFSIMQLLPVLAFIVVAAGGVALALGQQEKVNSAKQAKLEARQALGLPSSYPDEIVPIYPGARVLSSETGTAKSTDGQPMNKWVVKTEVDEEDREKIFEFYKELLLGRGMSQSMLIQIPSGYGVDYSDEFRTVNLVIEKKQADEHTQLEITLHELVK